MILNYKMLDFIGIIKINMMIFWNIEHMDIRGCCNTEQNGGLRCT